jgi:hypothetical protein
VAGGLITKGKTVASLKGLIEVSGKRNSDTFIGMDEGGRLLSFFLKKIRVVD